MGAKVIYFSELNHATTFSFCLTEHFENESYSKSRTFDWSLNFMAGYVKSADNNNNSNFLFARHFNRGHPITTSRSSH